MSTRPRPRRVASRSAPRRRRRGEAPFDPALAATVAGGLLLVGWWSVTAACAASLGLLALLVVGDLAERR